MCLDRFLLSKPARTGEYQKQGEAVGEGTYGTVWKVGADSLKHPTLRGLHVVDSTSTIPGTNPSAPGGSLKTHGTGAGWGDHPATAHGRASDAWTMQKLP